MKTEYRLNLTMTFETAAERDKAYTSLKTNIIDVVSKAAITKFAEMTKDEYLVQEEARLTEKIV